VIFYQYRIAENGHEPVFQLIMIVGAFFLQFINSM